MFDAAISLYAQAGWAGFTFEAIARRSGVGKAALYGRWPDRGVLLRQTLEARWLAPAAIDTGGLGGDLKALAEQVFAARAGLHARTASWMNLDGEAHPEVRAVVAPYVESTIREGRAIVRRAIARGEIPGSVNPGLLMDLVVGAVSNHITTTPERLRGTMIARREAFIETLVATVLKGVGES
ncbi:TetR/AcrR family transcriptional regulator [Caulobacter sp. KR2-114]|uniref:TetR/AcrR family transcriptional regulator n=1 Tax=Caulobacter sp. KR2-114 TaxID=3400912 RepID=UPI003BFC07A3